MVHVCGLLYPIRMPSRNIQKIDLSDTYYHAYARGNSQQKIFLDAQDYRYFIGLFARYLSIGPKTGKADVVYPHYRDKIELLAYCLMKNHFHLLLFQRDQGVMKKLMQSIMISYCRYFNQKYKKSGGLFESRYKASAIGADEYLQHVSRYIHLNPRNYRGYRYSSLRQYLDVEPAEWLQPQKIQALFASTADYETFVSDYEDQQRMLDNIKHELAGY
ncbi:MAG TPA: transposase [Candidatus Limnocylindria bacterium]|nr:transposase [Candidatus Limnocylindria bacterium]